MLEILRGDDDNREIVASCVSVACLPVEIDTAVIHSDTVSLDKCSKGGHFLLGRILRSFETRTHTLPYQASQAAIERTARLRHLFWDMHVNPDSVNKFVGSGSTFSDVRGLEKYSHASGEQ
jgi:hypothetical protein